MNMCKICVKNKSIMIIIVKIIKQIALVKIKAKIYLSWMIDIFKIQKVILYSLIIK